MHKNRIEAFSDGVLAIILTIMVLEMKVPHGSQIVDLLPIAPVFLSYVMSFIYIAIYWNNHHHLFQIVKHVNGPTLWANAHLLFWLSIVPFVTGWMGENHFAEHTVALYGVVLFLAAMAYYILVRTLLAHHGKDSDLAKAIGNDFKGKVSPVLYVLGIASALWWPWIGFGFYALVALIWLVPDKRVERVIH